MLSSLTDILSGAGFTVASAKSGLEAISMAENLAPELVISDVRMAGMDGIQCIEQLSASRPLLKSIVITGYASDDTPGRAMELATCDYLCKPFTAEQLLQSVTRALAEPPSPPVPSYPANMQDAMAALATMEATRAKAFHSLYLGIRAGHLGQSYALVIWDHLEQVENRRRELEQNLQLRLEAGTLQESYDDAIRYCKSPTLLTGVKRQPGGIGRIEFQPLFKKIREGSIAAEQIKTALQLRQTGADQAMQAALWG